MRRPPIDTRIAELRATLLAEPDPTCAARRLMSLVGDPAFCRDADPIHRPKLARRLWALLGRIGALPPGHAIDAPVPMERHGATGTVLGFLPAGLHPAPFVYFEAERQGLLVAPGRGAASHHRFSLPAALRPGLPPALAGADPTLTARDRKAG